MALSVSLSVWSVYPFVRPSVCLSVWPHDCLPACLPTCLPACLSRTHTHVNLVTRARFSALFYCHPSNAAVFGGLRRVFCSIILPASLKKFQRILSTQGFITIRYVEITYQRSSAERHFPLPTQGVRGLLFGKCTRTFCWKHLNYEGLKLFSGALTV